MSYAHIIIMRRQRALRPAAALRVFGGVVHENQIEVGIVIDLASTHFAAADDGKASTRNRAIFFAEFREGNIERALKTGLGKIGKLP